MIKSKDDYKYYLEADRIALGRKKKIGIVIDEIWTFEKLAFSILINRNED